MMHWNSDGAVREQNYTLGVAAQVAGKTAFRSSRKALNLQSGASGWRYYKRHGAKPGYTQRKSIATPKGRCNGMSSKCASGKLQMKRERGAGSLKNRQ